MQGDAKERPIGKKVLMPLPTSGFDPTEAGVTWKVLSEHRHKVTFATPNGKPSEGCDPLALTGLLKGMVAKVKDEALQAYEEMIKSPDYMAPISYKDMSPDNFDGIVLAGGHAPGMKEYLESNEVQQCVSKMWAMKKPVAALCHGVLVVARAKDDQGKSLLYNRKSTALPKFIERQGYIITNYLSRLPAKDYQLSTTWPLYVEDEVKLHMGDRAKENFVRGPYDLLAPLNPGTRLNDKHTFMFEDGNYLSSRFWGDAYAFALRFAIKLNEKQE